MDTNKQVRIEISGKVSYADDISLNQAAQIIAFIDSSSSVDTHVLAPATRLAPAVLTSASSRIASNPRDALDGTGAKTNAEKIVAFAKMVLDEGKDTFTLEDVKPLFRRAREATPKNITRDLDTAVRAGWIADADEKGEYFLTKKALDVLDVGFSTNRERASGGTTTRRPRSATSAKVRKNSTEVPDVFKNVDPIPDSIEGVPDYLKLKQDKDRFLWAILLGKTLGNDGLANAEIVWLTDRLGSGIIPKQITSKFNRARTAGHVNRSTQTNRIRITPVGEDYLKSLLAAEG